LNLSGRRDFISLLPLPKHCIFLTTTLSFPPRPLPSSITSIHHTKHPLHFPPHHLQLRHSRYRPSFTAFPHITFATVLQDEVLHSSCRAARRCYCRARFGLDQCFATVRCSSQSTSSILHALICYSNSALRACSPRSQAAPQAMLFACAPTRISETAFMTAP